MTIECPSCGQDHGQQVIDRVEDYTAMIKAFDYLVENDNGHEVIPFVVKRFAQMAVNANLDAMMMEFLRDYGNSRDATRAYAVLCMMTGIMIGASIQPRLENDIERIDVTADEVEEVRQQVEKERAEHEERVKNGGLPSPEDLARALSEQLGVEVSPDSLKNVTVINIDEKGNFTDPSQYPGNYL